MTGASTCPSISGTRSNRGAESLRFRPVAPSSGRAHSASLVDIASERHNRSVPTRSHGYMRVRSDPAPDAVESLRTDGYVQLRGVFAGDELAALRADVERGLRGLSTGRAWQIPEKATPFRYEMLNRSSLVQRAIGHPRILEVVEYLLGEDCHVIANTAWWQPPGDNRHLGRFWHIDAGPHVPRDPGVPWDPRIPYPVFAIATHLYLQDCPMEAGPTGVIPGSHMSGQAPPYKRAADDDLEWEGRGTVPIVAEAGDVALFASDVWHRRLPTRARGPRPDVRAVPLRTARSCSADSADVGGKPALGGGSGAGADAQGEDTRRAPSVGVLRRLSGRSRGAGRPAPECGTIDRCRSCSQSWAWCCPWSGSH